MAASIAFQASNHDATGNTSYTIGLTVGSAAGKERLIAVGTITNGATGITSVTVDGQAATRLVGATSSVSGGALTLAEFWRASGTSGTSINVDVVFNGGCYSAYVACWTLTDAGTVKASAANGTSTTSGNVNVNTTTDGVVAAASCAFSVSSMTWSGVTEEFDSSPAFGDDNFSGGSAAVTSGATPRTISFARTYSGVGNNPAAVAVSFDPAAGGTTLTAAAGSYALTGTAATLATTDHRTLTAAAGSYGLTGTAATFQVGGNFTLFCGSGSYTLTGAAATFPGYDPITPPVQPSTGGSYTGGAVYDTYRLRKKRKRDEIEELIDAIQAPVPSETNGPFVSLSPPPPALIDLMPKMEAVGLTPPQRKIVKRAIVTDDPDDDDEAIELLLNLLS